MGDDPVDKAKYSLEHFPSKTTYFPYRACISFCPLYRMSIFVCVGVWEIKFNVMFTYLFTSATNFGSIAY